MRHPKPLLGDELWSKIELLLSKQERLLGMGRPPMDLIDGAELAEKLREIGLGVRKEVVEIFKVDEQWFDEF